MYREVHVPKSLISKIFEPFLKSCTSEVRVPQGRVPRGLTVSIKRVLDFEGKFFLFFLMVNVTFYSNNLLLYVVRFTEAFRIFNYV